MMEESEEERENILKEEMWWKQLATRVMQMYALRNVGLKTLISGRKKMIKVSVIGFLEEINMSLYLAPVC